MRVWIAYTYDDGHPTATRNAYLSEEQALAEPGIERWYRVQGGWRGFGPDGAAWEVEAWDVLPPDDEQHQGDDRQHDQDGRQHGAAVPAVAPEQPITFIVRAGMMEPCGFHLGKLLECVKLRAPGILLIPEKAVLL